MNNYEILAFKDKCSSRILKKSYSNNLFKDKSLVLTKMKLLNNTRFWEIYSVRRLSDNVVFTIGDEIIPNPNAKYIGGVYYKNKISDNTAGSWVRISYPINSFEFIENKLFIIFTKDRHGQELDVIKPLNKPVMKEEFILPQNWYIVVNNQEEAKVYKSFFDKVKGIDVTFLYYKGFKYGYVNGRYDSGYELTQIGTLLTFEQFKKYVLKEDSKVEENSKTEETFVLPKFWKIKRNLRTNKEIGPYFDKLNRTTLYSKDMLSTIEVFPYLHNLPLGSHYSGDRYEINNDDYVEITFEQFKKYVLKQNDDLDLNEKSLSLNDVLNIWSELSGNTCESIQEKSTLFKKLTEFVEEQKLA